MLNISLSADKIIQIGSYFYITNTVLATWATIIVVVAITGLAAWFLKRGKNNYLVAGSKLLIRFFYKFINGILGEEKLTLRVLPLIATIFIFITAANWLGLVPGFISSFVIRTKEGVVPIFKTINADLNTTASMAITSIILIKILSAKFPEAKSYLKVGVSRLFHLIIASFEGLSELTRIISLSFRLTGNVFAGEVLMMVLFFLVPYFVPIPFMFLEVFIGIFQALIFSTLVLVFVKW
ncbi:MAG TPA: F0F1 ATP synthase subunit A [Candidatus Parcubacteria bacterium]|nr:F0F1 ATP synthase subunit A [Candidatus Parcubacteria bacterium]